MMGTLFVKGLMLEAKLDTIPNTVLISNLRLEDIQLLLSQNDQNYDLPPPFSLVCTCSNLVTSVSLYLANVQNFTPTLK